MLGFTVGFAVGLSLGVAIGGLFAPSSGEALRADIRRQIEAAKLEAVEAAQTKEKELLARYEEAKQ